MSKEVFRLEELQAELIRQDRPAIECLREAVQPGMAYTLEGLAHAANVSTATAQRHAKAIGMVSFKYGRKTLFKLEDQHATDAPVVRRGVRKPGAR